MRLWEVLVVDDNQDSCELISFLLEPLGVQLTASNSARQALAIIEQVQSQILVSDIACQKAFELTQSINQHILSFTS